MKISKIVLTVLSVFMLMSVAYAAKMYAPNEYVIEGGIYKTLDGKPLTGTVMQQNVMDGQRVIVQVDIRKGELDPNGEMMVYWSTGELMAHTKTKKGKLHGTGYEYYQNGKVKVKENYDNGVYDGKRTLYYDNGEVNSEMNYKNDVLHGAFRVYNREGDLQLEGTYDDGVVTKGACVVDGTKVPLNTAEIANWNNTQRLPTCY